jgi:hypothetical protein
MRLAMHPVRAVVSFINGTTLARQQMHREFGKT